VKSPSEGWSEAILDVLEQHGEPMKLKQLYAGMRSHPVVEPRHLELWTNGQPKYECWIRSELAKLKGQGKVRHAAHATYSFVRR
jgi:hypothetical protein